MRTADEKKMTKKQLLRKKRFLQFCSIEYGLSVSELEEMQINELVRYLIDWFKCPQQLFGPLGSDRELVRETIADKSLHE